MDTEASYGLFLGNKSHARGLQRSQGKILFSIDHRVNRPWPHHLINAARYRRRGDRITSVTSVVGTKRTWRDVRVESAFGRRAEVAFQ
ncbi:MAG TPA: hypothetical protein VK523_10590, partial [Steroidobacteraceae bacterium]|nr:hypothetical protein [Steroidobacteraceae bacterium]